LTYPHFNRITKFGDWQKLLDDPLLINRGIAGDNSFGVMARLKEIEVRQPRKLFIEIGINDFASNLPLGHTIKNILSIVSRVQSKSLKTTIYVLNILSTNDNVRINYPIAINKAKQIDFISLHLA
jgi:lysophospholipase L1-like esterase